MAGSDDITVDLEGEDIDPRAVADAIVEIEKLVKSLGIKSDLTLTNLSTGSAHVSMSAGGAALDSLSDGLGLLGHSAELPVHWQRESVQAVVSLGRITKLRGVASIGIKIRDAIARIDSVMQSNAESVLEPKSRTLGAISGVIYRYTNDISRKNRSAGLRHLYTGDAVTLYFSNEISPLIREHLETEVEVWGEIARDGTDKIMYVTVEGIEPIPVSEPTRASNGRGLLGDDWTGGIDPAEWVRMQRD